MKTKVTKVQSNIKNQLNSNEYIIFSSFFVGINIDLKTNK